MAPDRAVWAPPDTRRVGATRYAPCGRHPIRAVWAPPDSGGAHNTVGISGPEDAPALLAVAERGVVVVAAVPAGTGLCGLGLSGPLVRLQRRGGVPGLDALWFGVYRLPRGLTPLPLHLRRGLVPIGLPLRLSRWRLVGLGPGDGCGFSVAGGWDLHGLRLVSDPPGLLPVAVPLRGFRRSGAVAEAGSGWAPHASIGWAPQPPGWAPHPAPGPAGPGDGPPPRRRRRWRRDTNTSAPTPTSTTTTTPARPATTRTGSPRISLGVRSRPCRMVVWASLISLLASGWPGSSAFTRWRSGRLRLYHCLSIASSAWR